MGIVRALVLRYFPSRDSYKPPPISSQEVEAKKRHDEQMLRLREAIDSRKRIDDSVERVTRALGEELS